MVTSDLGACEWFVWNLRRSGLIDRGHLDTVVGEFLKRNPRAEAPALAEYLVNQQILSPYQAERILQDKMQGLVLGPYVIVDAIGSGSMGQVYKATSKTDNQWYAVKVLPRRSMWNVRLARRQVRAFSQFNHASVVPFTDVGTSGGLHYLVWPLAEGETLEAVVQREGRLDPERAARIGLQLAQGLTVCHQNGLFHGLLKPSNVMIGPDGQARLLDFGIGSLLVENEGESLVDTMSTANTLTSGLDCTSPECIVEPSNRTPAGDQYSLGCTLYFCLTGRYPFPDGSAVEKMMAHQTKQPKPIKELAPDVPQALIEVVNRLMQKAPDARFSACDEVADELEPFAGVEAASHTSHPAIPAVRTKPQSRFTLPPRNGAESQAPAAATAAPPKPAPQPAAAAASRAPLPTRGQVQAREAAVAEEAPEPKPAARRAPAHAVTPGWVPEVAERPAWIAPASIIGAALAVTAAVYFLGKTFLFPG